MLETDRGKKIDRENSIGPPNVFRLADLRSREQGTGNGQQ
ncbi:hypothetical protein CKA32_006132 [Geitlerinema sp. FC II]|nr:hypothetical protein CKA32_006132 [Geitlerinema sp. FC II]